MKFRQLSALPVLCAFAAVVVSAGACDRVKPPISGRAERYDAPRVQFADAGLRDRTAVEPPIVQRDDSGILYVTVPIRAATNRQLRVEYRATFFDRNGATVHQTTWFPKTLTGNVFDRIAVNSTGPEAADFQIDFRYGQ